MDRPAARAAGWAQETTAFPSISTVQAPQEPSGAHPSFTEVRPHPSRSSSRRVAPSRTSMETGLPLRVKSMAGPPYPPPRPETAR